MNNQVQEIELNIATAKKMVETGAALERLRSSRDFKKVIVEGFFEKEAIRLTHLLSDPNVQKPEQQASILSDMRAIGTLSQYFGSIMHQARLAAKSIEADEEALSEIAQETLTNG